METTIQILIDVALFLIASYFLFYRSFIQELGKQKAQLTTIEESTGKIETVRAEFTGKIESLKAELQKANISYQINLSELTKRRFDRIDSLYVDLVNLQSFVQKNMFFFQDDPDFNFKVSEFKKYYELADISRYKCSLYIPEELKNEINKVLNGAFHALTEFRNLYHTDTRKFGNVSIFNIPKQELLIKLAGDNNRHLENLDRIIDSFPTLLNQLESEFKKHIIFKEIN